MRTRLLHTDAFRLAAIYTAIFAITIAVLGASVTVITRDALREQILQFARADNAAVRSGYQTAKIHEAVEVVQQRMSAPGASDYFLLQQHGRAIAGNLPPMSIGDGDREFTGPGGHAILGAGELIAPDLFAFSGSDLSRVHAAESRILVTMLWLFLAALVVAAASGFLVSRAFLQRSDAMARACRAIMDGDMKARIPLRGTEDELDRLAGTINEMLDRIAALMENLRQVTNDIAHDLRTPVTHLRQRLERAKDESDSIAEYDAALDTAIEKTDEILALFSALLRIVQIEDGSRRAAFARIPLAPLLDQLREIFTPVAESAGHTLTIEAQGNAAIRGDRMLLVQLFSNLIENAIIHTPAGTRIRLRLAQPHQGEVCVVVSDDGPGVPREEHGKLFQRLYRREASRTRPGYGLGLALVAAVAELHGACVDIEPATKGFCVRVTFDAAA